MVFDSLRDGMGEQDSVSPMQIAHNSLFTAKEKIELLNQLKSQVTAVQQDGDDVGFDASEVDAAIADVRQGVENGVGSDTVLKGDF